MADGKRLFWMGSTRTDLAAASEPIRKTMGAALRAAQEGTRSADATAMKGKLRDVMEVRETDPGGTHRLMYSVEIGDAVYVLDFFHKKSKRGIATPKADLNRIAKRLLNAREFAKVNQRA